MVVILATGVPGRTVRILTSERGEAAGHSVVAIGINTTVVARSITKRRATTTTIRMIIKTSADGGGEAETSEKTSGHVTTVEMAQESGTGGRNGCKRRRRSGNPSGNRKGAVDASGVASGRESGVEVERGWRVAENDTEIGIIHRESREGGTGNRIEENRVVRCV